MLDYEEDDMSPLEARRHRFQIRNKEDSHLPMSRRWSRRRKQTHNKRCSTIRHRLVETFKLLMMIRRPGNKRRGERTRRRKQERSENRELRQNDGKYLFTLTDSAI